MIRKLILALSILALTTTPALARGGGGGFHGGGGGGFHGGAMGGGFHGGDGGGFHGGMASGFQGQGGFHGGNSGFHGSGRDGFHGGSGNVGRRGEFHGGRGFGDGHEHFDRFHQFVFVGPGFGFGVPFFWDPFWFPYPYPAYTYAPPLVIQQPDSSTNPTYWYYCVDTKAYYPYTQQCPGGWLQVVPTPVG